MAGGAVRMAIYVEKWLKRQEEVTYDPEQRVWRLREESVPYA